MDWEPDRSLQLRMLATLGVIAVLPLVSTYTLAVALNWIDVPMFNDDDSIAAELLSQELFPASHPPTTERIERLRALSADLES